MKQKHTFLKITGYCTLLLLLGFTQHASAQYVFAAAAQTQSEISASQPYGVGTTNQRLLRIDVTATGTTGTGLTFTQFDLNITGSAEISKISVYGGSQWSTDPDFTKPFGTVTSPGATISVAGSMVNAATTIRYYVIVDISSTATIGNPIDVTCTGITINGTSQIPSAVTTDRNAVVAANIGGTKTIKATGGNYTTLAAAFTDINKYGVGNNGITLVLDDDATYVNGTYDFNNINNFLRQSGTAANPIVIKRSGTGTAKPIVTTPATGSASDACIGFMGVDYLILDGLNFQVTGVTSTTKFETGISFIAMYNHGCSNNEVKNCKIDLTETWSTIRISGIYFATAGSTAIIGGSNNNNKIHDNAISNVDGGICFNTSYQPSTPTVFETGNEIYNNVITGNFGLDLGGIGVNFCKDTKIYNNILDGNGSTISYNGTLRAINGSSKDNSGYIYCFNNIVKNISNLNTGTSVSINGISVLAPIVQIYNNVVANLKAESTTASTGGRVTGISLTSKTSLNPYYYVWNNSVYLNQISPSTGIKTIAFEITTNESVNVNLMNNIFVNNSTGSNNLVLYAQYQSKSKIDATSDNNLYYPESTGFMSFQDATYNTLALYKAGMATKDQHAVSALPVFTSATDLHITSNNTPASNGGKSVAGVTTDLAGAKRNATTPDMGAYEFGLSTSKTTITGLNYNQTQGPSAEQTFTVTGSSLTGDITLTPTANLEISTGTGALFVATNPITLTKDGSGNVATTPIYVRLKAGLTVGSFNTENIAINSANETTQNVACSGVVNTKPTMLYWSESFGSYTDAQIIDTQNGWNYQNGTQSGYQTKSVSPLTYGNLKTDGTYFSGGGGWTSVGVAIPVTGAFKDNFAADGNTIVAGYKAGGSNEFWYSMLIRSDLGHDGKFGFNTNIPWNVDASKLVVTTDNTGLWSLNVDGTSYSSGVTVAKGVTALLVCKINFEVDGTRLTLFVNPTIGTTPTGGVTAKSAAVQNISSIGYYLNSDPGNFSIDELRIGDTYADVTPVKSGVTGIESNGVNTLIYSHDGKIVADLLSVTGATRVSVYDTKGSMIHSIQSSGSEILKINVPNKGLYMVRVQNGNKISTQKVVL